MSQFLFIWDGVLDKMKEKPTENTKKILFVPQIKNYKEIDHEIDVYDRAKEGDPEKTYQYLYDAAKAYLRRIREDSNRAAVQRRLNGTLERGASANVGHSSEKGKGRGGRN